MYNFPPFLLAICEDARSLSCAMLLKIQATSKLLRSLLRMHIQISLNLEQGLAICISIKLSQTHQHCWFADHNLRAATTSQILHTRDML